MDELVGRYNTPSFSADDPVQFVQRYKNKQDMEIMALLISTIAWGRRQTILKSSERLLALTGKSPYDFAMTAKLYKMEPSMPIHRTFFGRDLIYICKGLRHIYKENESMENLFVGTDMWNGIKRLRLAMHEANNSFSKHIANPDKSACKRLHLALRWLVRNDGITDLGVWTKISPSQLIIPLDVHVGNIARMLNITTRKSNDKTTAVEITKVLRTLDKEDPIKYDFALFGAGIELSKE